jgi:hypothetical protein
VKEEWKVNWKVDIMLISMKEHTTEKCTVGIEMIPRLKQMCGKGKSGTFTYILSCH